jgi:hypothetical protein
MQESWRHFLERVAANLNELDQSAAGDFGHRRAGRPESRLPTLEEKLKDLHRQFGSGAESGDLLALELEAISAQSPGNRRSHPQTQSRNEQAGSAYRPPVTYAVRPSTLELQPRRTRSRNRNGWRNLVAVSFSSAIIGLAGYALLSHGQAGKEGAPALGENSKRSRGTAIEDDGHTPSLSPKALSRMTEDALLERAADQLSHGDGVGARNIYETLAQYGSPRGALGLAETYDLNVLARRPSWGLKSDLRLAREWYKKAAELGSLVALQRLKDLDMSSSPG